MTPKALLATALALALMAGADSAIAQSWDDIVKAAEKEGEISMLTPPIKTHRDTVMQFQTAYPKIAVKATGMASQDYIPRLTAEHKANVFVWDAIVSGVALPVYTKMIPEGRFVPIAPLLKDEIKQDELWLGGFADGFLDKGKAYVYGFGAGISNNFFVDRSKVTEAELSSFEDMLNPKWKGKIAMYDPRSGPGGFSLTQMYMALGPDKTRKFLAEQGVVVSMNLRQIVEWAARGTYPITIGPGLANMTEFYAQGIGTSVKLLTLPPSHNVVSPAWGSLFVFNNAPHPNAARVFANWMLSKEGQNDWATRGNTNSRRRDVPVGLKELLPSDQLWREGLHLQREVHSKDREDALKIVQEVMSK